MINETDVGAAIASLIQNLLAGNLHTAMPGRVVKYAAGRADIQPLLKRATADGEQAEYPVLPDVQVLFGTKSALSITLAAGDIVLLIFCEKSLDKWTDDGKTANTTINRTFSLADGFAVPVICTAGILSQQALVTEVYKTSLGTYLTALETLVTSLGALVTGGPALVATFKTAYPSGFIAPANSLTSKVKAQ